MTLRTQKLFSLLLTASFLIPPNLHAYDEVKLERIIPLVDKKMTPSLLHLDPAHQTWIINDSNQSLVRLGADGKSSAVLMPGKKPSSLFKEPVDFGFTPANDLVVVDKGFERVAVIATEGKTASGSAADWRKAKILNQFPVKNATAVAVSHDGIIAVGYDGQASIDIFSMDGILLHRLFSLSEKYPIKKITALAYAKNGTLWALEESKGVLHRFSADRKWLGVTDEFEDAHGLDVDDYGFVYVSLNPGRWKEVSPAGAVTGVFGTKGKNPGEMLNPLGLAVADRDHVMVAEAGNNRLQEFRITNKEKQTVLFHDPAAYLQVRLLSQWEDVIESGVIDNSGEILLLKTGKNEFEWVNPQGETKTVWKKKGKGSAGFVHAARFSLDKAGKIWVSDTGDHNLKLLSPNGDVEKILGQKGKKEGGLKGPTLFSMRTDGSAVVADKDNSRVQVLSPNGLFLFQVGSSGKKEGQFSSLVGLASNDDLIAVADAGRKALIFYNASGKFVAEVANKEGKAPFWDDLSSLASDRDGRFYALDRGSKRVRIFNKKGQFLADFSTKGKQIVCGPDNRLLIIDDKSVSMFLVRLVPRSLPNVTAAEVEGDLQVSWDKSFEAGKYAVYRSSISGVFVPVTTVEAPPFSDRDVTPGVTYTYAVVGVNPVGNEGAWSAAKPVKAPKRKDVSLISIQKINLKPVFTAANKYYVTHPIGSVTIRNNDDKSFRNVKIALSLKTYSDFATEIVIPEIAAGEEKEVPVTMTFNNSIFDLTEDTPVQMEVMLSYFEDNVQKSISQNAPIKLYSRNTTSWNEKGRISSFITPKDPPVVDFTRAAIREHMAILKGSTVTKPLAKAALFYEAVNALGISYVPDPKTPFSEVSENPDILDYVQFPRETLRRKTGDCDDTTALMAALLESVGVSAALVDMPGHILVMADTGESDIDIIGLPEERFVKFQGTYWVPIETTRFGQNFLAAWQSGIARIRAEKNVQFIPVSSISEKYPPVTLVNADKDVPSFPADKVAVSFPPILKQLQDERYQAKLKEIKEKIKADPVNHLLVVQLGMVHVEGAHTEEANKVFISLLKDDETQEVQSSARNNLGNLAYLKGDYKEAAIHYEKAAALSPKDGGVLVNRGRTAWRLGDKAGAMKFLEEAKAVMPDWRDFTADIPAEYLPK